MEQQRGQKAVIIGASGSVGREVVKELLKSPTWTHVTLIVRTKIPEWDALPQEQKQKLEILTVKSLDELTDFSKWDFTEYSSMFCCLGALATEVSKTDYIKVNCTYPLYSAKLAAHFKIPHYSLTSGEGIHSKSWNSGMKARGVMEDELATLGFMYLSILKPGVITRRGKGERWFESMFRYMPCFPQITAQQVGLGHKIDAELRFKKPLETQTVIYGNSEIHYLVRNGTYPKNKKSK